MAKAFLEVARRRPDCIPSRDGRNDSSPSVDGGTRTALAGEILGLEHRRGIRVQLRQRR
jgi:hypothetical protein